MLHQEKQVIGVCSASVGKCFFFFFINLFKTHKLLVCISLSKSLLCWANANSKLCLREEFFLSVRTRKGDIRCYHLDWKSSMLFSFVKEDLSMHSTQYGHTTRGSVCTTGVEKLPLNTIGSL